MRTKIYFFLRTVVLSEIIFHAVSQIPPSPAPSTALPTVPKIICPSELVPASTCPLFPENLPACTDTSLEIGDQCEDDGECASNTLNNCPDNWDVYDIITITFVPTLLVPEASQCLALTPIRTSDCPDFTEAIDLPSCEDNKLPIGNLCEGTGGRCGTENDLNNCMYSEATAAPSPSSGLPVDSDFLGFDIYRVVGPGLAPTLSPVTPSPTSSSPTQATPVPTIFNTLQASSGCVFLLSAISSQNCPPDPSFLDSCNSNVLEPGAFCEGDGECGTSNLLNNCEEFDVYRAVDFAPTAEPSFIPSTAMPTTPLPSPVPSTSIPSLPPSPSPTTSLPTPLPSTLVPSPSPSSMPTTSEPSSIPSVSPTTSLPTPSPSSIPTTSVPSPIPSVSPTTSLPTPSPTSIPTTSVPSPIPSVSPTTFLPTPSPTLMPSTSIPSPVPSTSPTTSVPTSAPTFVPSTRFPSPLPSRLPTLNPTTSIPSPIPSVSPTSSLPTPSPSPIPSTSTPSATPTSLPSEIPTTSAPSSIPSVPPTTLFPTPLPSLIPSTSIPSPLPSLSPTSSLPTPSPSSSPTTSVPSLIPSVSPTIPGLTPSPSAIPTTSIPSLLPTPMPSTSLPTFSPTEVPSTSSPTSRPSHSPTTAAPSYSPTYKPTVRAPTFSPTYRPSAAPTLSPTVKPSASPTLSPTVKPSASPTLFPTLKPSNRPTVITYNPTPQPITSQLPVETYSPTTSLPSQAPARIEETFSPTTNSPSRVPVQIEETTFPTAASSLSAPTTNLLTAFPLSNVPTTTAPTMYSPTEFSPTQIEETEVPSLEPSAAEPTIQINLNRTTMAPSAVTMLIFSSAIVLEGLDAEEFNQDLESQEILSDGLFNILVEAGIPVASVGILFAETYVERRRRLEDTAPISIVNFDIFILAGSVATVSSIQSILSTAIVNGDLDSVARLVGSSVNTELSLALITDETISTGDALVQCPPQLTMTDARLDNSGAAIIVLLSAATTRTTSNAFNCNLLFDFVQGVQDCSWIDDDSIRIDVTSTTAVVGADITLLASVLELATECPVDCDCANVETTLPVEDATIEIVPTIALEAPESHSTCADLILDASASEGSAGQAFTSINWLVVSEGETVLSLTEAGLIITVSSDLLIGKTSLEITLTLTNVYQSVSSRTITIALVSDVQPTVAIIGGASERIIFRPDPLVVTAAASVISCGIELSSALDYSWTLTTTDGIEVSVTDISGDPRSFELEPFSLEVDQTFLLRVLVTDSAGGTNEASVSLQTIPSPLIAGIIGGNRTISFAGIEELSAMSSSDPDIQENSQSTLEFVWSCEHADMPQTDAATATCVDALALNEDLNGPVLLIDKSLLGFTNFIFRVDVSKPGREAASDAVQLIHATTDQPTVMVSIDPSRSYITNERFVLSGTAASKEDDALNVSFSLLSGELVDGVSLKEVARTDLTAASSGTSININLALPAYVLASGAKYSFQLKAETSISMQIATATVQVVISAGPTGGILTATPEAGTALLTPFLFQTSQWASDAGPLLYRFEVSPGGQVLRTSNRSPVLSDTVLSSGFQTIFVIATDTFGAEANTSVPVIVDQFEDDGSDLLLNLTRNLLNEASAIFAYEDICNVAIASAKVSPSDSDLLRLLVEAVSDVISVVLTTSDEELIALFSKCLEGLTIDPSGLEQDVSQQALVSMVNVLEVTDNLDFSSTSAINAVEFISQILTSPLFFPELRRRLDNNDTSVIPSTGTDARASSNISAAIDSIGIASANQMVNDEFPGVIETENVRIEIQRSSGQASTTLDAVSIPELNYSYAANAIRYTINPHRLESVRSDDLTSTEVVRVGLYDDTSQSQIDQQTNAATVLISIPPDIDATLAPTSSPLRENVTLVCEWNFRGTVSATCATTNETFTRECPGEKRVFVEGCGDTRADACVEWTLSDQRWRNQNCVLDRDESTPGATACRCDIDFGAQDYSTQTTLSTYAFVFVDEFSRGTVNPRRASVMIGVLSGFVVLICIFAIIGRRKDARDAAARKAETSVGAPPIPDEDDERPDLNEAGDFFSPADSELEVSPDPEVLAADLARNRSLGQSRSLDENNESENWIKIYLRALYSQHTFLELWTVYQPALPRAIRIISLGVEILLFSALLALEQRFEYPDPNCESRKSEYTCLRRKTWGKRQVCKWDESEGTCSHRAPPKIEKIASLDHFITVLVVTAIAIPFVVLMSHCTELIGEFLYFRYGEEDEEESSALFAKRRRKNKATLEEATEADILERDSGGPPTSEQRQLYGRKVTLGVPEKRNASSTIATQRRLLTALIRRQDLQEARARAPSIAADVRERQNELREDIAAAANENTAVGARKVRILHGLERGLVRKYGLTNNEAQTETNVTFAVYKEIRLARLWVDRLAECKDRAGVEKKFRTFYTLSQLTPTEREIYERSYALENFDDEALLLDQQSPPSLLSAVLALSFVSFLFLGSAAYMVFYASDAGKKETTNFVHELFWVLFLVYFLVQPMQILINYVALPSLVRDKVASNQKLNTARYPYESAPELSEDAVDFLLEIRPDLASLVPQPDDAFVASIRTSGKAGLTLHALEEINNDRKSKYVSTVFIGLAIASFLLALPNLVQDVLYEELGLGAPIAAIFVLKVYRNDDIHPAIVALIALAFSYGVILLIGWTISFVHNRAVRDRRVKLQRKQSTTRRFLREALSKSVSFSSKTSFSRPSSSRPVQDVSTASSANPNLAT